MEKKVAVLIIDPQNDFCNPNGALFVQGAEEDNQRLSNWINANKSSINYIGVTIDSHQVMDIAHPRYWKDSNGNHPEPYTVITEENVINSVWTCVKQDVATNYLKSLSEKGAVHVIWPEHCIIGTWGNLIDPVVGNSILAWAEQGHYVHYIPKGSHPDTEHFGAFEAEVPVDGVKSTEYNKQLEDAINENDVIYLAGQAKSHCVANTLKQIVKNAPKVAKKIVVLEDTMSPVPGGPNGPDTTPTFDELSQPVYDEARELGVRFSTTAAESLTSEETAQPIA